MSEAMFTVKRAIILAAGIGKRMQPVTLETPKPLIRVNGVRIIDTVVDALWANGIYEIYVVAGHLKEQFYSWAEERKGIEIIENPYYKECNNISSLYVAREHLGDCMIIDGDQIVINASVLDPHFRRSGYNAAWREEKTEEWIMRVRDEVVDSCSRTGGSHGWQLYSVSRWTEEDGEKLRKHLEMEFESGNRQIYWDDVVMFYHFSEYVLGIWKMNREDIIELDSIEELAMVDHSYRAFLNK